MWAEEMKFRLGESRSDGRGMGLGGDFNKILRSNKGWSCSRKFSWFIFVS